MSRSLNKVHLIGRLGADPQMRYTTSGVPVTSFSVATNRQWQGKDGVEHDETDWHSIVAWDRLGQICSEHLSRGRLVYIEGRLQNRSWEQDGQTRYKTEIIASDMLILDPRGTPPPDELPAETETRQNEELPAPAGRQGSRSAPAQQAKTAAAPSRSRTRVEPDFEDDPEDLPF